MDPKRALAQLDELLEPVPSLIIDGLFGIGLSRPLDLAWLDLIEALNKWELPILSVDVPSGLDADSGDPRNEAVYAEVTVTLGAPKRGLLSSAAYPFTGRVEVANQIGLIPCPFSGEQQQWGLNSDFDGFPPARRTDGHKGTFGHVAIFAGSHGYHGAAVLASRGALRARPGLVSTFCDRAVYEPVASQSQAAMVHAFRGRPTLPESCTALVIGPGLAARDLDPAWKEFVNEQWRSFPMPVLVDASALAWIEPGATALNSRRILTPHPGEAGRLLGVPTSAIQHDRIKALREISGKYGNCWVVLKGHQTLVGRSSGEVFVNPSGNPYLAQGGSGDVLSGFLGGLLAQPRLQAQPLKTIRYGVWAHGLAADQLTETGRTWTVDDLLLTLGDRD
jgi:NAD(P)H-hydrate epimerase